MTALREKAVAIVNRERGYTVENHTVELPEHLSEYDACEAGLLEAPDWPDMIVSRRDHPHSRSDFFLGGGGSYTTLYTDAICRDGTRWNGKHKDDVIKDLEERLGEAHREINALVAQTRRARP